MFYLTILFVIATLNGVYTNYINSLRFSWANYWWIINRTFILGGIPIAFITMIDFNRKLKSNLKEAKYIVDNKKKPKEGSKRKVWQIVTDLKSETIEVDENNFMYAIAIGNYIDVFIIDGLLVKKTTYRITLASFERQLDSDHLKRCHRSYLINLRKVGNISGNAQGLRLKLLNQPDIVPVSRKYIPIIKRYFLQVG
ncbi:MAG: LytTR family transcriptional regulator DNA-binding domain-containing protein [Aurantibacter sp.]